MTAQDKSDVADRQIVNTRVFPFPREVVFAAWTDPERMARWWGPRGFTNTIDEFDFRPGGQWDFVMHGPDGSHYPNQMIFAEIVRPERIVLEHVLAPRFRLTATLEDAGGQTRLTWQQLFESAEVCEKLRALCEPANEQNLDRLGAELQRRA